MIRCAKMSERDPLNKAEADRTLLGVAPPQLESAPDSNLRSPVFVRSGTSSATDVEPPPLPRMALPSRPPRAGAGVQTASSAESSGDLRLDSGVLARSQRLLRLHPVLWMVVAPVTLALAVIGLVSAVTPAPPPKPARVAAVSGAAPARTSAERAPAVETRLPTVAELEARPLESLSSRELLRVAEGKSARRLNDAKAFREKLAGSPELIADKAAQVELLRLASDNETAHEALAAMASVNSPVGADLLYEVWTGTPQHNEITELARALVYSLNVRPRASAALGVALELRAAQSCEQYQAALPKALKEGDRRSLVSLTKLVSKRGCGSKKNEDCFACLRGDADELKATLSAAKSRRAPAYPAP